MQQRRLHEKLIASLIAAGSAAVLFYSVYRLCTGGIQADWLLALAGVVLADPRNVRRQNGSQAQIVGGSSGRGSNLVGWISDQHSEAGDAFELRLENLRELRRNKKGAI